MIEHFVIFTRGGLVLWTYKFGHIHGSPVDALVRAVLVEERSGLVEFIDNTYALRWAFDNAAALVLVAVYEKVLPLTYVDTLLERVRVAFTDAYGAQLRDKSQLHEFDFLQTYRGISTELEQAALQASKARVQRSFAEVQKSKSAGMIIADSKASAKAVLVRSPMAEAAPPSPSKPSAAAPATVESPGEREAGSPGLSRAEVAARLKQAGRLGSTKKADPKPVADAPVPFKKAAAARKNDDVIRKGDMAALDYSKSTEDDASDAVVVPDHLVDRDAMAKLRTAGTGEYEIPNFEVPADDDDDDDEAGAAAAAAAARPGSPAAKAGTAAGRGAPAPRASGMFAFFQNLTGQKPLDEQDLEPAMAAMREHLISKNVASDIADSLCKSVAANLIGKKPGTFKGVAAMVRESMEPALQRILTPKSSTDVLRDVMAAKQQKRPYTMVFCGVNGVGKSTNLAKITFWLLQNKLRVLIAACDTFRSGAVEQLRVHVRNLRALDADVSGRTGAAESAVELYEKGYGKDAADIARDAISYGKANKFDVVMIDTAGRMQDNAPLMRALAKLVKVNNPDKVIFVGEALVGNDGVDQLVKFNNALKDFAETNDPRQIDGILLTKFDTIDDKVGAALSMTYSTGQPILFVGTGQTYTDLKKMNVGVVVRSLLY